MRRVPIAVTGMCAVALTACGNGETDTIAGLTAVATETDPTTTPPSAVSTGSVATTMATTPGGVTTPGGAPTSTAPSAATTSEPSAGPGDDGFDSVQWGPDDPPIPGEYQAFAVTSADGLSCESIDDRAADDRFWGVAAQVCRAIRDTDAGWPDPGTLPSPQAAGNLYEQCLDNELFAMLGRALAWHDENPGNSPNVRFPGDGTHSPCQKSIYGITVAAADPAFDDGCDEGESPERRVLVTMSVPGIPDDSSPQASVDGAPLCVTNETDDNALRVFTVVVPTSGEPHGVTIAVDTNYGPLSADVALPAVDAPPPEPSVVTTSTLTPFESTSTTTGSTVPSTPATTPEPTPTPTPDPTPPFEPTPVPTAEPTPELAPAGPEPPATDGS